MIEYIERVAAMAAISDLYPGRPWLKRNFEWWSQKNKAYIECENAVQSLPAADVAPVRHGRWADHREQDGAWSCTACGEEVTICSCGKDKTWEFPYCPNCGAKMNGGADDD